MLSSSFLLILGLFLTDLREWTVFHAWNWRNGDFGLEIKGSDFSLCILIFSISVLVLFLNKLVFDWFEAKVRLRKNFFFIAFSRVLLTPMFVLLTIRFKCFFSAVWDLQPRWYFKSFHRMATKYYRWNNISNYFCTFQKYPDCQSSAWQWGDSQRHDFRSQWAPQGPLKLVGGFLCHFSRWQLVFSIIASWQRSYW